MKKYRPLYLVIILVYIVTAINSSGYHHPDEHFQIIEFAGLKQGWNSPSDLTWEYDARIRPALQPMIASVIFSSLNYAGITDPFLLSIALRLLTALLSFVCVSFFINGFMPNINSRYHLFYVLISFLLWFLPAVNIRFSSETWAGLMLLPAVVLLNKKELEYSDYIFAGIFLGLSFEVRFQMGIILCSLLLWFIFIKKEKAVNILFVATGTIAVVLGCIFLDSWFYGEYIITPWNYFECNILDNAASHFGVSPWYYYMREIMIRSTPLLGIVIIISIIICCRTDYKNIILWCILPFLIIHSMMPHKELRFLFPVINLVPFVIVSSYQYSISRWSSKTIKAISYSLITILILTNSAGVIMMSFKPAMYGKVEMINYLSRRRANAGKKINVYTIAHGVTHIL